MLSLGIARAMDARRDAARADDAQAAGAAVASASASAAVVASERAVRSGATHAGSRFLVIFLVVPRCN